MRIVGWFTITAVFAMLLWLAIVPTKIEIRYNAAFSQHQGDQK
jgi:hypothetical protein